MTTTTDLTETIRSAAEARRLAVETETEAARALNVAQGIYERQTAVIDGALDQIAAINATWAAFEPDPDIDGSRAAVVALAQSIPDTGDGIDELPAMILTDDGWVIDPEAEE